MMILLIACICTFVFLVSYQPLCNTPEGLKFACVKIKYLSIMGACPLVLYVAITLNSPWIALALGFTLFMCVWKRVLWWIQIEFPYLLQSHHPALYFYALRQYLKSVSIGWLLWFLSIALIGLIIWSAV